MNFSHGLVLFTITAQMLSAATTSWTGVDSTWSNTSNWTPTFPAQGDTLTFPNTASTFTVDYTTIVSGNNDFFALNVAGPYVFQTTSGTTPPLGFGQANMTGTSTVQFSGFLSFGTNEGNFTADTQIINVPAQISGTTTQVSYTGNTGFTPTYFVTGTNTYTGTTLVGDATINIGDVNNLGTPSGGALALEGNGTLQVHNTFTLSNSGLELLNNNPNYIDTQGFDLTISAPITSGGITPAGSLNIINSGTAGTGSVILTNTGNTYGGNTSVTGTALVMTNDNNIGSGTTLTLNAASTLRASATGQLTTHNVTLGGSATIDSNGNSFTISTPITGTGPLNVMGTGTGGTFFSGTNTFSGQTTVPSGTLTLQNTAGQAIGGDLLINGSGTVVLQDNNQIPSTAIVTLDTGGTFNMNSFSNTIGAFYFYGGTFTGASSLTLANTQALVMRNVTLSANVSLTNTNNSISFDSTNNGTALITGNIDMGGNLTTYSIDNGTATVDMNISGVISGGSSLLKATSGTLEFSGTAANTFTGQTQVSAGELLLNKTGAFAIGGNALIDGGTLTLAAGGQIPTTSSVTLDSGTFDLGANATTIDSFTYNGGTFNQEGALLTLTDAATALTMRNVSILGPVSLSSSGGVVFDATNGGTALIAGTLDLGSGTVTFTVPAGGTNPDMNITGAVSNGKITKTGTGILELSSANTYAGGTLLSQGTLALANNTALGTNSLTMSPSTTLDLEGNLTVSNAISTSGTVSINVNSPFSATLPSSSLTTAGTVNKTGAGTLLVTGSSVGYGAATDIIGGTLSIDTPTSIGSGTVSINDGTALDLAGSFTFTNSVVLVGGTDNINVNSPFIAAVSGGISGSTLGKTGAGTLSLPNANTYTGGTNLNAGTLSVGNSGSLGAAAGLLTMGTSTVLDLAAMGINIPNNISLAGSDQFNINSLIAATLSGNISGTGPVTITGLGGGGHLTLSGSNSYTSGTNLNAGTLTLASSTALGNSSGTFAMSASTTLDLGLTGINVANPVSLAGTNTFTVNSGISATLSGSISGTGPLTITGTGGTLELDGNNSYSSGTNLNAGTLNLGNSNALGNASGTLAMAASTTLGLGVDGITISNPITLAGSNVFTANSGVMTSFFSGNISGTGPLTISPIGTVGLSGNNSYTVSTLLTSGTLSLGSNTALGNGANPLTMSASTTLELGIDGINVPNPITLQGSNVFTAPAGVATSTFSGNISGTGPLTISPIGTVELSGNNSYTVGTSLTSGTLSLGSSAALGNAANPLTMSASTTLDLAVNGIDVPNPITLAGTNTFSANAGITTATFSGDISGTGPLTIAAPGGAVGLSGNNSYSVGTNLTSGTLSLGSNTALGNTADPLTMSGSTTLNLALDGMNVANPISISSGTDTITVNSGITATLTGSISGTGPLAISGGTLSLPNANTYTGGTNLNAGILSLGNNGGIGAGNLTMATSTEIDLANAVDLTNLISLSGSGTVGVSTGTATLSGAVSGTGPLIKTGAGTLSLPNGNTYNGGTNLNGGILSLGNNGSIGTGTLSMMASTEIDLAAGLSLSNLISLGGSGTVEVAAGTATLSGAISGTGSLIKTGAGTLSLPNANSYSGGTNLNDGILVIGNSIGTGTLRTAASTEFDLGPSVTLLNTVSLNGAETIGVASGTGALLGIISSTTSSPILKTGAGTLSLYGANTFTGDMDLSAGTLFLGNSSGLGIAANTLTMANATVLNLGPGSVNAPNMIFLAGAESINVSSGGATLSGVINGISFTKTGGGALTLANANTYIGGTTLSAGLLSLGTSTSLGTGDLAMAAATELDLASSINVANNVNFSGSATMGVNSGTATLSGLLSGAGPLIKNGMGTLALSSANTYSSGTNLNVGGIVLENSTALGNGPLTMASNTVLSLTSAINASNPITLSAGSPAPTIMTGIGGATLSGVISGSALTKTGSGVLTLSGVNTYNGGTMIHAGGIFLTNSSSVGSGDVAMSTMTSLDFDPTLSSFGNNIIFAGAATLSIPGTTTLSGVLSGGGSVTITGGAATLTNSNSYTGGTLLNAGILSIGNASSLGTGSLTMAGSTELALPSAISLGIPIILSGPASINTAGGGATLTGVISGGFSGSITKTGPGALSLNNSNTYTAGTDLVTGSINLNNSSGLGTGALLMMDSTTLNLGKDINANNVIVFDGADTVNVDKGTSVLSGMLLGSGSLTKTGSGLLNLTNLSSYAGATNVNAGRLSVNGSIAGTGVTVAPGAILGGNGTINTTVVNSGTLQPGNSIGTLTTGSFTFTPGSVYDLEINPTTSDLLISTGTVNIDSGASLFITPETGSYSSQKVYPIIESSGGVSGQFSTVNNPFPLFTQRIDYTGNDVFLIFGTAPFSSLVPKGNGGKVAKILDKANPLPGSDMAKILEMLLFVTSAEQLQDALVQMQPSILKGLALSQQNMTVRIRSAVSKRSDILLMNTCLRNPQTCYQAEEEVKKDSSKAAQKKKVCDRFNRGWSVWFDSMGDISRQRNQSHEKGFKTFGGAGVFGADYQALDGFYVGASGAYSYDNINWNQHTASGDIQSLYGTLYGTYAISDFYVHGEITGAHNKYYSKRHLEFLAIDRSARNKHSGNEAASYLSVGGLIQLGDFSFNPFISADYIWMHQNGFKEHGANSLNLRVKSSNSNYLRGEAGFNVNGCISGGGMRWVPNLKFGVIREWRFMGRHYRTELTGTPGWFTVTGLNPDRTLLAPGISMTTLLCDDHFAISFSYDGEFGKHYWEQSMNLQLDYSF